MTRDSDEVRPQVSVVVASFSGEDALSRCLDSVLAQPSAPEILVATNLDKGVVARLGHRYPTVKFLQGPPGASVFALRALGVARATGRIVALTEDHCTVCSGWLAALMAGHEKGHGIVGGPVDNGLTRGAYNWALYFSEYGVYMPPQPEGPARVVSGLNVAYERELLRSCQETWRDAFRENEVHDVLGAGGEGPHIPYMSPDALVYSHLGMGFAEAMRHLFGGGRHFGAYRRLRAAPIKKMFWALASPGVPLVLLARIVRRVVRCDPRRLWPLVTCTPFLIALLGAWSLGEAVGYVGPRPGDPTSPAAR